MINTKQRKERDYYKFWAKLKVAQMDEVKKARLIYLNLPYCMMARVIKAIRKEKDRDYEFKQLNLHDPWRLKYDWEKVKKDAELTPHSIVLVTLKLDRRSDL